MMQTVCSSVNLEAHCRRPFCSQRSSSRPAGLSWRRLRSDARAVAVRSQVDDDAELEARLAKLRIAKGATPYGEGAKKGQAKSEEAQEKPAKVPAPVEFDYTDEKVYYEGPPHRGDLVLNLALGTTLVWIPLTIGALVRAACIKYRFTDKRFTVTTTAPWEQKETHVAYQQVADVVTVARGLGAWGDMVVTLQDKSKVELRSLDRFKELKEYILSRRDALKPPVSATATVKRGKALSQEELLGEKPTAKKGFSS